MQFVLVNNGFVELGPREWNYRLFKNELEDLEFPEKVIPVNNTDYLNLGDGIEIYPAEILPISYNLDIEQLSGPFWDFSNNKATGSYNLVPLELNNIKSNFKNKIAAVRYKKEIAGSVCTIQGEEIQIDTTRDGRNIYVQKYLLMGDTDTVNWKFNSGFKEITKAELGLMIESGLTTIQSAFNWEKTITDSIDAAISVEEILGITNGLFI